MKFHGITVWQKSDLDGFFGLFTNNITNILVMTGALLYTVQMPEELVYGRILPAVGLGLMLCSILYFWAGYRLARRENRDTVTAMPSGISVPHMFLMIYMIILPVKLATNDPLLAWQAGVAWCFLEGIVETAGSFIGPWLRKRIPRAAMLGSLAGASLTIIMTNAAVQSFELSYVALASFCVILLGFVAKRKMPFGLPAGLTAIVLGTFLGWVSGAMDAGSLAGSFSSIGLYPPVFCGGDLVSGMKTAAPYLVSAVPMGIYNFIESVDNVESASAVGDSYNTAEILAYNGVTSMLSAAFGSPIPTAVYIGHPGWKSVGARLGYCLLTGVAIFAISLFGLGSVLINAIPLAALMPILISIGIQIGSQAFEHVPVRHFPAVILSMLPWFASWAQTQIDNTASALGASVSLEAFRSAGIYYQGFSFLGNGSSITGMLWAALVVFLLERKIKPAVLVCLVCAALTFFGVIHADSVGFALMPAAVLAYLFVAAIIAVMFRIGRGEEEKPAPEQIEGT